MIKEKDILFGVVKEIPGKTAIIMNIDNALDGKAFMGAMLAECALHPRLLSCLKYVVEFVETDGDSLREKLLKAQASGRMVVVNDKKDIKS